MNVDGVMELNVILMKNSKEMKQTNEYGNETFETD